MGGPGEEAVDAVLRGVPDPQRRALEDLRSAIRRAAPAAEEYIGYGVPAFRLAGALVSYGAAKAHCAFYVQSLAVMERFAAELGNFDISKGTIRFTPERPIPDALVERIVAARVEENRARRATKKG